MAFRFAVRPSARLAFRGTCIGRDRHFVAFGRNLLPRAAGPDGRVAEGALPGCGVRPGPGSTGRGVGRGRISSLSDKSPSRLRRVRMDGAGGHPVYSGDAEWAAPMRAGGRRQSWPALGSAESGASLDEALSLSDKILSSHGGIGMRGCAGRKKHLGILT